MRTPFRATASPSRRALLCLALVAALAGAAFAQENMGRGRVTGTVTDESGAPLEGVKITARSMAGTTKLETMTDKKGAFAMAGFGTGGWSFTAARDGFVPGTQEVEIKQLKANPPVTFALKRLTGLAGLKSDKASADLFDRGSALFAEEKYDEALAAFTEFSAKYPDIYQARLNIASCFAKKGDPEKAGAEYQLVLDRTVAAHGSLQKDPSTSIRALSGLGELALKKDDFEGARKLFSQALEISPEDEAAAYNVGEIFFSNQKIDEAIVYFEMANRIKKDWPKPLYKLGIVYVNKGDLAKSLEYLNKTIQVAPDSPEAAQAKGMIAAIEKMKK
jgi:tetratricopeptide (TPR) repeat protein